MTDSNIAPITGKRFTEEDYVREREKIRETFGDNAAEAKGLRDQAMAKLFYVSGWTQEEVSKKKGKSRIWITVRLRFGHFLNFVTTVTTCPKPPRNLTEGRFRGYWEQTTGTNEHQRFTEVAQFASIQGLYTGFSDVSEVT